MNIGGFRDAVVNVISAFLSDNNQRFVAEAEAIDDGCRVRRHAFLVRTKVEPGLSDEIAGVSLKNKVKRCRTNDWNIRWISTADNSSSG